MAHVLHYQDILTGLTSLLSLPSTTTIPLAMLRCLEGLDPAIFKHGNRVGRVARAVGERMGLSLADLFRLELAGRLHDIGKLFVPAFLVHKQAAFNLEEYRIMQRHAVLGAHLLEGYPETVDLAQVARHHHERWDGSGYPARLAGLEIPQLARIISVADAYDAVTSNRSGGNRSHSAGMKEIRWGQGTQFCPDTVDAFLNVAATSCTGFASEGIIPPHRLRCLDPRFSSVHGPGRRDLPDEPKR